MVVLKFVPGAAKYLQQLREILIAGVVGRPGKLFWIFLPKTSDLRDLVGFSVFLPLPLRTRECGKPFAYIRAFEIVCNLFLTVASVGC